MTEYEAVNEARQIGKQGMGMVREAVAISEAKVVTDRQTELMRKFWEETPDQPAQRPLSVKVLKQDFFSLIAKIELLEAKLAATLIAGPASSEPVKVKPLEWIPHPDDGSISFEGQRRRRQYLQRAVTPFGAYFLMTKDDMFSVYSRDLDTDDVSTVEEAKEAAQADYEQRIRSALADPEVTP